MNYISKQLKKKYTYRLRLLDFTSIVSELVCMRSHLRNYICSEFPGVSMMLAQGQTLRTTAVEIIHPWLLIKTIGELEKYQDEVSISRGEAQVISKASQIIQTNV